MNIPGHLQHRARLPAAVYDLAMRLGVRPDERHVGVKLTQTGRMRQDLKSTSRMAFTATQTLFTRECAFDWRARFGPFGLISVRDALDSNGGRLEVKALGIVPITRAPRTPELMRGELMRYLAELPWAPAAILINTELCWRNAGPDALAVSAGAGATATEVILSLDNDGRIVRAFAPDRPRSVGAVYLPTPWRGQFTDYRLHEGRWIPFAGEVAWEIDGRPEVYWQGTIKTWACV